ncbi:Segregation and condensation protein B [Methanosarcinaceae archaeon Ag5]|uniref:Segregation and condensation protein B n=1 Tax=Methanolapillus africanus TaxID=3028297 RepID=A0AAE4MJQ3_9EURY|nr:Segregation and condensation protein B [Methanosarcinaceae archaeon Ag5]
MTDLMTDDDIGLPEEEQSVSGDLIMTDSGADSADGSAEASAKSAKKAGKSRRTKNTTLVDASDSDSEFGGVAVSNAVAKQVIEAALFAAGSAVSVDTLMKISGKNKRDVREIVADLREEYLSRNSGIEISDLSDRFVMQVRPDFAEKVRDVAPKELTSSQLKTLSIIAYHQPITQSDVVEMRGGNAYEHIGELSERGFIDLKPQGRTKIITTTRLFADYFGMSSSNTSDIRNKMVEILRTQGGQSNISRFAPEKRVVVTEMYESLARMCGMTNYKVANPYNPSDDDKKIIAESNILILAKGYADKVLAQNPAFSGQMIEVSSTTFGDLIDDITAVQEALGDDFTRLGKASKAEENIKDLKEFQDIYRKKALMIKSKASPATEMSAKLLNEMGVGISIDGILVAPDYGKSSDGKKIPKGAVTFPTHKSQSGNLIKRVCEKYDAVITGLKDVDKAEREKKAEKAEKGKKPAPSENSDGSNSNAGES